MPSPINPKSTEIRPIIRSIRRSYVATPYFRSFGGRSFGDLELEWSNFNKKGTVGKLFSRRSHYNSCILEMLRSGNTPCEPPHQAPPESPSCLG
eukprot:365918-Chlamydomonas_euryale.AAC.7